MTTQTRIPTSSAAPTPAPSSHGAGRFSFGAFVRANAILAFAIVLFVVLAVSSPSFLTPANLLNILTQQSPILIMGVAGVFVLVAGGLDLSIGATYSLAGVVAVTVANAVGSVAGFAAALVAGLLVGTVNGIAVAYFRINSLIATIAVSFLVNGLSNIVSGSSVLSISDPSFTALALTTLATIRLPVIIAVVLIVLGSIVLSRSAYGRRVFATGGNVVAARLAGIRVRLVLASTFAISGVAAALAGLITASQVSSAQAGTGDNLEFTVLTGIVVGGVSILGGEGSVWRGAVGVTVIALVGNGSDQLGINPLYQTMILGAILLVAVGLEAWLRMRRRG